MTSVQYMFYNNTYNLLLFHKTAGEKKCPHSAGCFRRQASGWSGWIRAHGYNWRKRHGCDMALKKNNLSQGHQFCSDKLMGGGTFLCSHHLHQLKLFISGSSITQPTGCKRECCFQWLRLSVTTCLCGGAQTCACARGQETTEDTPGCKSCTQSSPRRDATRQPSYLPAVWGYHHMPAHLVRTCVSFIS